jgi:AGZA family xanthine/uracil permease-like MFS transporter
MATWAPPNRSTTGTTGLDRYFHISERGSTPRTEVIAGITTWLTMAYIIFLNPIILGTLPDSSGNFVSGGPEFDRAPVAAVTALVAAVLCLAMGLYTNYPFAMAAGLGLNAFVTFTLVSQFGLSWPQAMGVIVLEGLIITLLVLTGFRTAVLNAIPMDLKRAIGIGIGLFIALIGLVDAGIVVHPEAGTPIVTLLTDLTTPQILVFVIGFFVTAGLVARRMKGALLVGILFTTILAIIFNAFKDGTLWPEGVAEWPSDWVGMPDLSMVGQFSLDVFDVGFWTAVALIVSVMLSDFFDTMGTVIGIGGEAKLLDNEGKLPGINRVLLVDSLGAAAGGAGSASSNTTYIESAAGVAEGGRTGLTAVVVGVLFLLVMFFSPLARVIPFEATAPALVIVGFFMIGLVRDINWTDPGIGIPALLTIIIQPFTFSITNGVGAGFISYTVIQVLRGRAADVHWLMYVVSAIFVWYFFRGLVG